MELWRDGEPGKREENPGICRIKRVSAGLGAFESGARLFYEDVFIVSSSKDRIVHIPIMRGIVPFSMRPL
jgi:hypothetical protein